ncbi:MAG TPA: PAS domain S-box protein [Thermosynechococcaceae cyanobacterium]
MLKANHSQFRQYSVVVLCVVAALGLTFWLKSFTNVQVVALFYGAVAVSTWYGGTLPGLLSTLLSTLCISYFFTPPVGHEGELNLANLVRLGVFVLVMLVISSLNAELRSARRRSDKNLKIAQTNEQRYRILADNVPNLVWLGGADGATEYFNQRWYDYTGLSPDTSLGWEWQQALHPEDKEPLAESWQDSLAQDDDAAEAVLRLQRADGTYRWHIIRAVALRNTAGEVINWFGTYTDIHDQKQMRLALLESEERLRVALKNSPLTVFNQDQNLRYTWLYNNPGSAGMADLLIGKRDEDLLPPGQAQRLTELKQQVMQSGKGLREEIGMTLQGQTQEKYFDLTIEPLRNPQQEIIGITCAAIDITRLKRTETALRDSRSVLDALLAGSPIGLAFLDRDLRYQQANEALATINGIPLSHHLGRTLEEILPSQSDQLASVLHQVMTTQVPVLNQEMSGRTAQGKLFHCLVSYYPVCLTDGEVLGVGVAAMDIASLKRTEQALRDSEARFRRLVQSNVVGCMFWRADGAVLDANDAFLDLVGYTAADLQAGRLNWRSLTPADQLSGSDRAIAQMQQFGRAQPLEKEYFRKDGSRVSVLLGGVLLENHTDRGVSFVVDLSDRKRAEAALKESEERFRQLAENLQDVFWISQPSTGQTLYVSPAFETIWGQPIEVAYDPDRRLETLHPDDRASIPTQFSEQIEQGRYDAQYRIIRPDGSLRWIRDRGFPIRDESGQVVRVTGIAEDITERKQSEAALQSYSDRLEMALNVAQMGSWEWDLHTNLLLWTPLHETLFDYEPGTPIRSLKEWADRVHPDDLPTVEALLQAALTTRTVFECEYRVVWRDGSIHWVLANAQVQSSPSAEPSRMVGVIVDITERKRVEAERLTLLERERASREAAESANQLKDEFLAVLSHELRSPLNPILGWTQLLRTRKFDAAATDRALETIERNAKLQTQLIEDLLDVSRILRGKMSLRATAVNLQTTIEAAMETVRLAAEARAIAVQFETEAQAQPILVWGDANRLQQVVWNLLSNAIKFTPDNGRVVVGLTQTTPPLAQITITDTGKGIQPEFLPHVFEYFRQADSGTTRQFGGLGLGLAIAHHLVELHGGTVQAESQGEGQGATFTVRLPLLKSDNQIRNVELVSPAFQSTPLVNVQILVVDDEADMRDYVAFVLEQAGATVTIATSAAQALDLLSRQKPDLLITDIGMPQMDGYALLQQVRGLEQSTTIPAIALTAYASELDQRRAIATGFQAHLAKPVEPDVLLKVVSELVKVGLPPA